MDNWLCKSASTTSRRPDAVQLPTIFLHHLNFSQTLRIFQDQMYIHFVWQPCLVVDGCWCCIENLWPTKTGRRSSTTICRPSKTTRKKGGCRRSARGCRCNSLTTSRRSSTNICRPPTTSGNHPKNSGCQRSATGCRYSVTVPLGDSLHISPVISWQ